MKPLYWFGFRAGLLAILSVILFHFITRYLPGWIDSPMSGSQWGFVSYGVIGGMWAIGLMVVRFQFNNLPEDQGKNQKPFDFKRLSRGHGRGLPIAETLVPQKGEPSDVLDQVQEEKPPKKLGDLLEGAVGRSIAFGEVSMELEVPEGETVNLFGTDLKVSKGKIKIVPGKGSTRQMTDLFPKRTQPRIRGPRRTPRKPESKTSPKEA